METHNRKLITKGAEALIFGGNFLGYNVIYKKRLPKAYRLPEIDNRIRIRRLRSEAKTMVSAWMCGVHVPELLGVNLEESTLIFREIEGPLLFIIMSVYTLEDLEEIFLKIGEEVGLLHDNDLIHGDLTVFNIIITNKIKPWLIDFGLGGISGELEKKADDLLTFYSTLKAITPNNKILFDYFRRGYERDLDRKKIVRQMRKIMSRARYIAREHRLE